MRPTLNSFDQELLNAYFRLRREAEAGKLIKKKDFGSELDLCACENDVGTIILQRVDDHYIDLYLTKLKAERQKG